MFGNILLYQRLEVSRMSDAEAERLALERQQRAAQLKRSGQWRLIVGGVLTLTFIGAVIGLPLGYSGYRKLREAKRVQNGGVTPS
jgi:hypothetical protein